MSDFVRMCGDLDDDIDDLDIFVLPEENQSFTPMPFGFERRLAFLETDRSETAMRSASASWGDDTSVVTPFLDSPLPSARSLGKASLASEFNVNNNHLSETDGESDCTNEFDVASDDDDDSFIYDDDNTEYDSEQEEEIILRALAAKSQEKFKQDAIKQEVPVEAPMRQKKKSGILSKIKRLAVGACCVLPGSKFDGAFYDLADAEAYDAEVYGHAKGDYCCESNKQTPASAYVRKYGICVDIPPEQFAVPIKTVTTVVPRVSFMPNYNIQGTRTFTTVIHHTYIDMDVDDDEKDEYVHGDCTEIQFHWPEPNPAPEVDAYSTPKPKKGIFTSIRKFFNRRLSKRRNAVAPMLVY